MQFCAEKCIVSKSIRLFCLCGGICLSDAFFRENEGEDADDCTITFFLAFPPVLCYDNHNRNERRRCAMYDKKAIALLKKYYLPYSPDGTPSEAEKEAAIKNGVVVQDSVMTHDEIVAEIKALSERITLEAAAKAFLYSLSSGDTRYRSALGSLLVAKAMPAHSSADTQRKFGSCFICGCSHGLDSAERIDWNYHGVFRYLPPTQYGNSPDYICAEYVLNDLREFEKLTAVEPCDADYDILNRVLGAVSLMKSHNKDSALVKEINRQKILNTTANGVHCLLGILSMCSILAGDENKGFLHSYTNYDGGFSFRDGLTFFPLFEWKGKNGVNYQAVEEIFGSFSGGRLTPDKAVTDTAPVPPPVNKTNSRAEQYFIDGQYTIMLTDEERRYLALDPISPEWETASAYSVTHWLKKRTVYFYEGNTIVKVIFEEHSIDDNGGICWKSYQEFDTRLETDNRTMLLPLTSRGRAKPVTPTNVMAVMPFGCDVNIYLKKGDSSICAGNLRNRQYIALGENERLKNIAGDSDFHAFMEYYISTCPDDYFERIAAVRSMGHTTVRFRAGDIFRCQVDRAHYAYGLILGKTRDIEKWKELPKLHSFRHLMMQPIIVRMYDFITDDRDMTAEKLRAKPLRTPDICSDCDILWGTHPIVAHKELEPDDIMFGLNLARQIKRDEHMTLFSTENFVKLFPKYKSAKMKAPETLYVEWGFVSFEMPWKEVPEELRRMLDGGRYYNGGVSLGIHGEYCGMTLADILKDGSKNLLQYDLLLPENRDKFALVMRSLGLPEDCGYDDFAEKYGGITRAEYISLL